LARSTSLPRPHSKVRRADGRDGGPHGRTAAIVPEGWQRLLRPRGFGVPSVIDSERAPPRRRATTRRRKPTGSTPATPGAHPHSPPRPPRPPPRPPPSARLGRRRRSAAPPPPRLLPPPPRPPGRHLRARGGGRGAAAGPWLGAAGHRPAAGRTERCR